VLRERTLERAPEGARAAQATRPIALHMAVAQASGSRLLRPAPTWRRPTVSLPLRARQATRLPSLPLDGASGPCAPAAEEVAVAPASVDGTLTNNAQVAPWGTMPQRTPGHKSRRAQDPPLPPLVDRMLSSPSLENAEGAGASGACFTAALSACAVEVAGLAAAGCSPARLAHPLAPPVP
jgi:hypothetical protein